MDVNQGILFKATIPGLTLHLLTRGEDRNVVSGIRFTIDMIMITLGIFMSILDDTTKLPLSIEQQRNK